MDLDALEKGRIVRESKRFYGGIAAAVVLLALSVYLWTSSAADGRMLIVFTALAVVGLGYAGFMVFRSGSGICPKCRHLITGLSLTVNPGRECPGCQSYVESSKGILELSSAESLAPHPVFRVSCPEGNIQWPQGCCVCQEPATRTVEVELEHEQDASLGKNLAVGAASAGLLKMVEKRNFRLQVPHCAAHSDGAELDYADSSQSMLLIFRSKRYADLFQQLNP